MGKRIVLLALVIAGSALAEPIHINMCYRIFGQKECVRIYQKRAPKKGQKFVYQMKTNSGTQRRSITAAEAKRYKFAIRRLSTGTFGRGHEKCKESVIWQEKDAQKVTICVSSQPASKKLQLRSLLSQIIH